MFFKLYDKQIEVMRLKALESRVPTHHPKKEMVVRDLKKKKSEVAGEKELDYPLGFLDSEKYLILHNIRLKDENGYFQIDTLVLASKFYLILEVKNWQGTVIFDDNGQVIRKRSNEEEEGFPNPIPQVKTQTFRLRKWLRKHSFPEMEIESFIVIAFPSTIVKSAHPGTRIPEQVILNNQIHFKILELEKKPYNHQTSIAILREVAQKLLEQHTPTKSNLLQKYRLDHSELIKGVFCPECQFIPMIRSKYKWTCTKCGAFSRCAHRAALEDYQLLIGNTITNKQAREFLLVESPYAAKRILQSENLIQIGNKKGRIYRFADKNPNSPLKLK
ncbi:nuclease-related domain-containing protein [Oceanobacillus damuensis]|uniref:nuclease-related domain-containing protein n=1 Tax=Oceanobacillus damuensis TaxID=937928 RepID=UPI0008362D17|nr:nuclease-related domain-containing protein [Oceanobacillus damuensis]